MIVNEDNMVQHECQIARMEVQGYTIAEIDDSGVSRWRKGEQIPFFSSSDEAYDYWKSLKSCIAK